MRMPTNDSRKLSDDRIKVELVQVMQDIHRHLVNLDYLGHGQRCGPGTLVDIAFHCHDRSNLAEFVEHLWFAYISPAWMINSEPSSASTASGRRSPWYQI